MTAYSRFESMNFKLINCVELTRGGMHLISIRKLHIDANQFPDVKKQVEDWYATVKKAEWTNLEDVRLI